DHPTHDPLTRLRPCATLPAMTAEDVDTAIIRPMKRMFPAPRHLRADEDAYDATLSAYRKSLARFDQAVLEQAWQRVVERNTLWCWPKLSDLIEAAQEAQRTITCEPWVEK